MSKHSVIWKEGLFVKPQHFQQEQRAVDDRMQRRLACVHDQLYGFSELELDPDYLAFGKIAIVRARGVMPDGTVFDMPNGQPPPPPLVIADASLVGEIVYLALPQSPNGALEVQWPGSYANARYVAQSVELRDTHTQEGDHVHVDVAVPNLQLVLHRDDPSAYTALALGRIHDKRSDGSVTMDEGFYPTSVSMQAVPPLKRFLGEVAGLMRERARTLAERIASPTQTGVADVTDFGLLQTLNRLQPYFQHLTRRRHVHPEQLYVAFAQACGELVTFTDEARLPAEYPPYRHDELHTCFKPLQDTLRRTLSTVLQPRAVSIPLEAKPYGVFMAPVHDRRLIADAAFILAVRAQLSPERLQQHVLQQAKITALEHIDDLLRLQLPGIPLRPLPVAPRHLPFHAGYSYFELDRTDPAWATVHEGTGFGLHVSGDFPDMDIQFWAIRSQA